MALSNLERQARWRAKRDAEMAALHKAAGQATRATKRLQSALFEARREMERLRQHVAALEQVATPRPAKASPKPLDSDSEVARLKTMNRNLRIKVANMTKFAERQQERTGAMPFASYAKIMRALRPDQTPTEELRQKACGLFSQWWQVNKKLKARSA